MTIALLAAAVVATLAVIVPVYLGHEKVMVAWTRFALEQEATLYAERYVSGLLDLDQTPTIGGPAISIHPPGETATGFWIEEGRAHFSIALKGTRPQVLTLTRPLAYSPLPASARAMPWGLALALGLVVFVLLAFWVLRRSLLGPLEKLTQMLRDSDYHAISGLVSGSSDLPMLTHAIAGMQSRINEDQQTLKSQLEEVQESHRQLEETGAQLVRSERMAVVGQLAAGLAHEIGNPLAIIQGYVDMLLQAHPPLAPSQHKMLVPVDRELARIQGIVRNLLDFSRAEDDWRGSCQSNELLAYVEKLIQVRLKTENVRLLVRVEEHTTLGMSKEVLTQVLLNLLFNAMDALAGADENPEASIEIRGYALTKDQWCLEVHDNGPGVSDAEQQKIFEPFFTTKGPGEGTGLGLAVCERIMTSAQGQLLLLDSDLGGACFRMIIPTP